MYKDMLMQTLKISTLNGPKILMEDQELKLVEEKQGKNFKR